MRFLKIATIVLVVLMSTNCNESYEKPSDKDVQSIIQTLLKSKHLPPMKYALQKAGLFEYSKDSFDLFNANNRIVVLELSKYRIIESYNKDSIYLRPARLVSYFLNLNYKGERLFSSKDSIFLTYQNRITNRLTIDSTGFSSHKFISSLDLKGKQDNNHSNLMLSVPVFSIDYIKACVFVDFNDGGGIVVFFKRVNMKWMIIGCQMTSIS
jgi:hypothetical protein